LLASELLLDDELAVLSEGDEVTGSFAQINTDRTDVHETILLCSARSCHPVDLRGGPSH
jgi:hypothetical protein